MTLNKIFIIKRHRLELMDQSLELQVSFRIKSLIFKNQSQISTRLKQADNIIDVAAAALIFFD